MAPRRQTVCRWCDPPGRGSVAPLDPPPPPLGRMPTDDRPAAHAKAVSRSAAGDAVGGNTATAAEHRRQCGRSHGGDRRALDCRFPGVH